MDIFERIRFYFRRFRFFLVRWQRWRWAFGFDVRQFLAHFRRRGAASESQGDVCDKPFVGGADISFLLLGRSGGLG